MKLRNMSSLKTWTCHVCGRHIFPGVRFWYIVGTGRHLCSRCAEELERAI